MNRQFVDCLDRERLVSEYARAAHAFAQVDEAYREAAERAALDDSLTRRHENARVVADCAWLALDAHVVRHKCVGSPFPEKPRDLEVE